MSLQKINVKTLLETHPTLVKKKTVEGYASKLCVEINEMLPMILNNGQINAQMERYEVSFTVNDNMMYGVNGLAVETYTQTGWESVESVESGENHTVRIESEFIFIVFFHNSLLSRRW